MLQFTCETCHYPLKASTELAGRLVRCPKCQAIVPAPKQTYPVAPIETAEADEIRVRVALPEEPEAYLPAVSEGTYLPDLADQAEYEYHRRRQNRTMLLVSLGIVCPIVAVVLFFVVQSVSNSTEAKRASLDTHQLQRPRAPAGRSTPGETGTQRGAQRESEKRRQEEQERQREAERQAQLAREREEWPQGDRKGPSEEVAPTISLEELKKDHERIKSYVKSFIQKTNPIGQMEFTGPWRAKAKKDDREGRLYFLSAVLTFPGVMRPQTRPLRWYFFLCDVNVLYEDAPPDPSERSRLQICKVVDKDPMTPAKEGQNSVAEYTEPLGRWKKDNPERARRCACWSLRFNTADGQDYARQLSDLGAWLAIPVAEGRFEIIRDFTKRPLTFDVEENIGSINRVFWTDDNAGSVRGLASALGLNSRPAYVIALFPEKVEKRLIELERKLAAKNGRAENQISNTTFEIRKLSDGRYDAFPTSQTYTKE